MFARTATTAVSRSLMATASRAFDPPFVVAAIALCLSANLYGYRFSGRGVHWFNGLLTLVTATLFVALCITWARSERDSVNVPRLASTRRGLAAGAVFVAITWHLSVGSPFYSAASYALALASFSCLLASMFIRASPAFDTALLAVVGIATMVLRLLDIPFRHVGGDMLPIIDAGVERFLAGQSPYEDLRIYSAASLDYSGRPLTYLPLMWLSYVPLKVAALDLRWLSIASLAACYCLLSREAWRGRGASLTVWQAVSLVLAAVFLSPLVLLKVSDIQTPVFWFVLACLASALAARATPVVVGALCAVAVVMRETAIIVMLFIAIYYARQSWPVFWRWSITASVLVAATCIPFLVMDAKAFMSSLIYNSSFVSTYQFERQVQLTHIGFGGWLMSSGLHGLIRPIQVVLVLWVCWHMTRRKRTTAGDVLFLAGGTYFAFLLLNDVVFEYYYIEALVLIGFAMVSAREPG